MLLGRRPRSDFDLIIKRAEDIVLSLIFLIILSPLLILTGILVKIDSDGPVFFRQKRHGFANDTFYVFKFRSMYVNTEQNAEFVQAIRGDKRVSRIGKFIRRTSIDELPQLINVLKGDMSIVGPRPHPIELSTQMQNDVVAYLARHKMKPGITGWAQINGHRGETETADKMQARVDHDIWYVDNWSTLLDIKIIILTIPALMRNEAY